MSKRLLRLFEGGIVSSPLVVLLALFTLLRAIACFHLIRELGIKDLGAEEVGFGSRRVGE